MTNPPKNATSSLEVAEPAEHIGDADQWEIIAMRSISPALHALVARQPIVRQCEILRHYFETYLNLKDRRNYELYVGRKLHPPIDWPYLTDEAQLDWAAELTLARYVSDDDRDDANANLRTAEQQFSAVTNRVARNAFKARMLAQVAPHAHLRPRLADLEREIDSCRLSPYGAMNELLDILE